MIFPKFGVKKEKYADFAYFSVRLPVGYRLIGGPLGLSPKIRPMTFRVPVSLGGKGAYSFHFSASALYSKRL